MRAASIVLLLLALGCSSFASQRVRQASFAIEEMARQTEILLVNDRISADQAQAVESALRVARAQVGRYWEAVKSGAPRSTTNIILEALDDALREAELILTRRDA